MTTKEVINYIENNCNVIGRRGNEIIIECIFCNDKRMHCHFNPCKQLGVCFKCGKEFNFIMLVASLQGISYSEARRQLKEAEYKNLSIGKIKRLIKDLTNSRNIKEDNKKFNIGLPRQFIKFKRKSSRVARDMLIYLYMETRGYSRKELEYWKMGYCKKGFYSNRVIIPVKCNGNKSFVARTILSKKTFKRRGIKYRKYINPKGSKHSKILYNYDIIKKKKLKEIVLVEGVTDVHNLYRNNVYSMATFGKKLSDAQIDLLLKTNLDRIFLAYDNDAKDKKERENVKETVKKMYKRLSEYFDVDIIRLPRGKDPGNLNLDEICNLFKKESGVNKNLKKIYKNIKKIV